MSAGRAIVSTPYAYARERLAKGRGSLVAAGSSDALATALVELLADPKRRASYGRGAYESSRGMVWSAVGAEYARIFAGVTLPAMPPLRPVAKLAAVAG